MKTEDIFNEGTKEVAVKSDWDNFTERQKTEFAQNSIPVMPAVKFHGDLGQYSESIFDKDSKEWVKTELGKSFEGVILAVRFLAKWKWKDNATHDIRTREFSDFTNEPIELLKINNADRSAPPDVKRFDSYGDFKAHYGTPVPETDEVKYPHNLWVSLYILTTDGQIKRFRFAGTSRSAWFDYKNLVETPTLVLTKFGTSQPIEMNATDENGQKKRYYSATFSSLGEIPVELRDKVMTANRDLTAWMAAWVAKRAPQQPVVEEQVTPAVLDEPPF